MFGDTPILDDFTGADQNPITDNWTTPLFQGSNNMRRLNNAIEDTNAGFYSNAYLDLATYGPDCEFYAQIVSKPASTNDYVALYARTVQPGGGVTDGFEVAAFADNAGTDYWHIYEFTNDTFIQLGGTFFQEFSVNDWFGIEAIADQISAWYKPSAGSWTSLATRTSALHNTAGYFGVETGGSGTLDNVGGGTVGEVTLDLNQYPPHPALFRSRGG